MRKKITVSKLVLDILDRDAKQFNMTKERLCNEILITFSIRDVKEIEREELDEKAILQFTLSRSTSEYYNIISKKIENEPKFLRSIFTTYAHLNPFYREIMMFRDRLITLKDYISRKEKIYISIGTRVEEVLIIDIIRCPITDYIKLRTQDKGEFYLNEFRMIL
ncbi:MAG: hypothetical protein Q4P79_06475 [Fusobacterium sp.]|nr:hypothetical protein [Fusobacterium sp.]MDO5789093.1 hypothetical protein [Fusobacterium sp.]